jgi:hypothetical protein
MAERMRRHIAESKEQARRLEELLAGLGSSESTVKDTVLSIAGNLAGLMHAPAPDGIESAQRGAGAALGSGRDGVGEN